jgi:hypothetical protein
MPTVHCPGCGRAIEVAEHEIGTLAIICAGCETRFETMHTVAPPQLEAMSADYHCSADDPAPRHGMMRSKKLALVFLGGCGAVGFVALLLIGAALRERGRGATRPAVGATAHNDPYSPDCAIVPAYLRQRYGGECEVRSWGRRTVFVSREFGGTATLSARFRPPGGKRTLSGTFTIDGFNTVETALIDE